MPTAPRPAAPGNPTESSLPAVEAAPSPTPLEGPLLAELRRHELLRPLLRSRVVQEAVAAVKPDPDLCRQRLENYVRSRGITSPEALQAHLQERGLSEADLRWQLELPLRMAQHAKECFGAKSEQRFLERKDQLDQVVYSLLRVKDPYLAQELYLRIDSGESVFSELAATHAEGHEKQTHGIVGPVSMTQAHPVLAEKLRVSPAGKLLEPFRIEDWWLVLRLERYTPATFDEAMDQRMCGELFEQWIQEEVQAKMQRLTGL